MKLIFDKCIVITIILIILSLFLVFTVKAQEEKPIEEEPVYLLEPTCPEACGYSIDVYPKEGKYEVKLTNKTKWCENIEMTGDVVEAEGFIEDKCEELCGLPESPTLMVAPNYKNCIECVPVDKICRTFLSGTTKCWPRPGAIGARNEHCTEEAEECFNSCKTKSKIHQASMPQQ